MGSSSKKRKSSKHDDSSHKKHKKSSKEKSKSKEKSRSKEKRRGSSSYSEPSSPGSLQGTPAAPAVAAAFPVYETPAAAAAAQALPTSIAPVTAAPFAAAPELLASPAPEVAVPAAPQSAVTAAAAQDSADADNAAARPGTRGRNYTISLAVPGSIVAADVASAVGGPARGKQARTAAAALVSAVAVARQIAAAAFAGCMDEVVVYDDGSETPGLAPITPSDSSASVSPACAFLAQALQYFETPPYLRKALCHLPPATVSALDAVGSLHAPHHPGQTEWVPYREGVVLKSSPPGQSDSQHAAGHCFIDVGLDRMAFVPMHLPMGARVTLAMGKQAVTRFVPEYSETMVIAEVVASNRPRLEQGLYRGFEVRLARSLHRVLKDCPYSSQEYDLTIGTSVTGIEPDQSHLVLPRYSHALLVFGGATRDLQEVMEGEENLADQSPGSYFNMHLNVCPAQGSGSIRTEDAVLLTLGLLRPSLLKYGGNVGQK